MTPLGKVLTGTFPDEPPEGWKTCGSCGLVWWRLEENGLCYECDGVRRAEIIAEAKRGRRS
jgi:allophanate hydrolase subunit 1